jgi:hypothetical protein
MKQIGNVIVIEEFPSHSTMHKVMVEHSRDKDIYTTAPAEELRRTSTPVLGIIKVVHVDLIVQQIMTRVSLQKLVKCYIS